MEGVEYQLSIEGTYLVRGVGLCKLSCFSTA